MRPNCTALQVCSLQYSWTCSKIRGKLTTAPCCQHAVTVHTASCIVLHAMSSLGLLQKKGNAHFEEGCAKAEFDKVSCFASGVEQAWQQLLQVSQTDMWASSPLHLSLVPLSAPHLMHCRDCAHRLSLRPGREQARSAAAQRGASAAEQQQAAAAVAGAEGADRVAWAAGQPMPKEDMPEVLHAPEMPAEQPEAAKPAPRTVLMDFVLNPGGSDDEDVEEDFSSSEEE